MVRGLSGIQVKHRKRVGDFMLIYGLNEAMEQLAVANNMY